MWLGNNGDKVFKNLLEVVLGCRQIRGQRLITMVCHCPFTLQHGCPFRVTDLAAISRLLP